MCLIRSWRIEKAGLKTILQGKLDQPLIVIKPILMPYRLLILLFIAIVGLNGQLTAQTFEDDTLALTSDRPDANETKVFNNCILLPDKYTINTSGKHVRVEEWKEVDSVIEAYKKDISKRRFFVISDSHTSYGEIIRLLSILKDAHISNYRVMNLGTTFQQDVPVPSAAVQVIYDASYLMIHLLHEGSYQVTFRNDTLACNTTEQLDSFITAKQPVIDGNKLVLTAADKTLYSAFKPVIDVLKKHDYWQFQVKKQ